MLPIRIESEKCRHCKKAPCIYDCPADCLAWDVEKRMPYVSNPEECTHCGNCRISCPNDAITIIFPLSMIV